MNSLLKRVERLRKVFNEYFSTVELLPAERFLAITQSDFDALEAAYARLLDAARRFAGEPKISGTAPRTAKVVDPAIRKGVSACERTIALLDSAKGKYSQDSVDNLVSSCELLHLTGRQLADLRRNVVVA